MTSPIAFIKETRSELEKVKWPTRQEVVRLTLVVLAICLIVGVYISVLDLGMTTVMQTVLK